MLIFLLFPFLIRKDLACAKSCQVQAEALVILTWNQESTILSDSITKKSRSYK
jgi:hypothetical protein